MSAKNQGYENSPFFYIVYVSQIQCFKDIDLDKIRILLHWAYNKRFLVQVLSHIRMGHYFFSYLLTWEVDLTEILEIMPQMWQYVILLSLEPTKVTSDFIRY